MAHDWRFYKMTGSGNDFVFLDGREHRMADWPAERIRQVCDRRRGIGADGIVHIERIETGAIRMIYYNADGSHAGMCGNAALCTTRLAVLLGLVGGPDMILATDTGELASRCVGPGWSAELRYPVAAVPQPSSIPLEPGELAAFHGTVGVPHTIIAVQDVASVDVQARGRTLRFAPDFAPDGANINFVSPATDADADWALRTYERGVEGETLACGTGTIAAALAFAGAGRSDLPVRIRSSSGSVYSISGDLDGTTARDVWLCGEGRLVFTGSVASP